ncbi:hypothetical protein BDL97_06G079600 [Sphagnum fallax]|nr:hypothetical protein BDL97_06G079600 [Sphagnum fallax]
MPGPKLISLQAFRRLLASPCLVPHHPLEPAPFYSSTFSSCPFTPGLFFSRVSHGNDLQISLRSCFSSKSGAAFFPGSFRHLKDFEYPHFYELGSPVAAPEEAEGEESGVEQAEGGRFLPFGVEDDGNQVLLEDGEPYLDMDSLTYLHVLSVDEVCKVLERVRANDVKVLPVQDRCEWADNLIIASAHSTRHLRGIADSIVYEVKKRSTNVGPNLYPTVEGRDSDQWMVVDCGNLVVHVFREDVRSYYNLEELWQRNKTMSLPE